METGSPSQPLRVRTCGEIYTFVLSRHEVCGRFIPFSFFFCMSPLQTIRSLRGGTQETDASECPPTRDLVPRFARQCRGRSLALSTMCQTSVAALGTRLSSWVSHHHQTRTQQTPTRLLINMSFLCRENAQLQDHSLKQRRNINR